MYVCAWVWVWVWVWVGRRDADSAIFVYFLGLVLPTPSPSGQTIFIRHLLISLTGLFMLVSTPGCHKLRITIPF